MHSTAPGGKKEGWNHVKKLLTEAFAALYILAILIGTLLLTSDVPAVGIAGLGILLACVLVAMVGRGGGSDGQA